MAHINLWLRLCVSSAQTRFLFVGGGGEEAGVEVEEVGLLLCAGQRGVEPSKPFEVDHLLGEVALVDDDGGPLAALALVGGDRVGELDLKSLGARVLLGGLGDFTLAAQVAVVEHDVFKKRLHARTRQAGAFDVQDVQHHGGFEARCFGKVLHFEVGDDVAQAIAFEAAHDFLDHEGIAVGDEVGRVSILVLEPMVVVADHHQAVAGVEFLLAPEDATADLFVEVVRPFVGARDDDHVLFAVPVDEVVEEFRQRVAGGDMEVGVVVARELWERGFDIFRQVFGKGNVLPEGVGVGEDAAVEFLADDVVEGALGEREVKFSGQLGAV